jgi:Spy/CpxP family protein refolding chaperone
MRSAESDKFMKRHNYLRSILIVSAIFVFAIGVMAQETPVNEQNAQRPAANKPPDIRTAALRQLGLSPEQAQQIRKLNMERKPLMDNAQRRLREANRALDEVIYADNASDADVHARLKDFQLAQAEVARIRFTNELAVRRILTPDQLFRFRRMRQRFEEARENAENRNPAGRQVPDNAVRPVQRPVQNLLKQNLKRPRF